MGELRRITKWSRFSQTDFSQRSTITKEVGQTEHLRQFRNKATDVVQIQVGTPWSMDVTFILEMDEKEESERDVVKNRPYFRELISLMRGSEISF